MKPKFQVICGDCLIELPKLTVQFDACITDPPYGTTACAWDSVIPFAPMWANLKRLVKRNGAIVLFGSQPFTSTLVMSNPQMFKYQWYWKKERGTGFAQANNRPLNIVEDMAVFYREQPTYNPQRRLLAQPYTRRLTNTPSPSGNISRMAARPEHNIVKEYTHDTPTALVEFTRDNGCHGAHMTQKPVELMRYLVRTYTNEGDTVLDFAAGSFTTGVACMIEGRNFVGIEQSEDYCRIGEARMKRALGVGVDIPKINIPERDLPLFKQ